MTRSPARAKYAKVTHPQSVGHLLGDGKISARKCVGAETITGLPPWRSFAPYVMKHPR
jgi:hypothetical protein